MPPRAPGYAPFVLAGWLGYTEYELVYMDLPIIRYWAQRQRGRVSERPGLSPE